MTTPAIAIVGAGPRGISLIERIAAYHPTTDITIHLIDDSQIGAGRIWLTDQTRTLCMNTLAGAVTLFTEPGSTVGAPFLQGPTQYEWIQLLKGSTDGVDGPISPAKIATFRAHPPAASLAQDFAAELADTRPESHPTRALYGAYLAWVYDVARAQLPETVTLVEHHARVTALRPAADAAGAATGDAASDAAAGAPGADILELSDGTTVRADATVLAIGWQRPGPTPAEQDLAAAIAAADTPLTWVRPDNPIEQDLSQIAGGQEVLVRGFGMGFFDAMALLTIERGGRFEPDPQARSGLVYHPSGAEPHLTVSSHRGYPYLPKSDYGGLPPRAELTHLRAAIERLTGAEQIDFTAEVWPAIVRDAYAAYYRVAGQPDKADAVAEATVTELLANTDLPIATLLDPLAGLHGSPAEVTDAIGESLARDIAAAAAGASCPVKAGLWSISASRKPVSILGSPGRYTADSRAALSAFMALGQMVGSGPPLFRSRQLLALIDAHLVTVLGSGTSVTVTDGAFEMRTDSATEPARGTVLIDAWMHQPDIRRPEDPLARSLEGRWRPFQATGSPEVDEPTRALITPAGTPDPRVHLVGIPTYGQLPDTTISPMPGTDPLMLQETDKTARHLLETVAAR